jgi:YggT family protein
MRGAGAGAWAELAVVGITSVLLLAIIVRVIGGWLGAGRYTRWMRPFYLLTNWLIEPIRRRLPAFGPIDLSPLLAYVLVLVIRNLLLNVLEAR